MANDSHAGIICENALKPPLGFLCSVTHDHQARMDGKSDADSAPMMHTHPACPSRRIEQGIEDRPVGNRVASVEHLFSFAVGRGDTAAIQVIASDHDRGPHFSVGNELVEDRAHSGSLAVSQPANAGGESLERDLSLRLLNPSAELLVFRERLHHSAVGAVNILGIAGKSRPSKWTLAITKEWSDVFGNESRYGESILHTVRHRFAAYVISVVEDNRSHFLKLEQSAYMIGNRFAGKSDVFFRILFPQL